MTIMRNNCGENGKETESTKVEAETHERSKKYGTENDLEVLQTE